MCFLYGPWIWHRHGIWRGSSHQLDMKFRNLTPLLRKEKIDVIFNLFTDWMYKCIRRSVLERNSSKKMTIRINCQMEFPVNISVNLLRLRGIGGLSLSLMLDSGFIHLMISRDDGNAYIDRVDIVHDCNFCILLSGSLHRSPSVSIF